LNNYFTKFDYNFKVADVVKGTIVKLENNGFLVDIGAKSEALLSMKELSNLPFNKPEDIVKIGETRDFLHFERRR
jgi:ribosomal protein S1